MLKQIPRRSHSGSPSEIQKSPRRRTANGHQGCGGWRDRWCAAAVNPANLLRPNATLHRPPVGLLRSNARCRSARTRTKGHAGSPIAVVCFHMHRRQSAPERSRPAAGFRPSVWQFVVVEDLSLAYSRGAPADPRSRCPTCHHMSVDGFAMRSSEGSRDRPEIGSRCAPAVRGAHEIVRGAIVSSGRLICAQGAIHRFEIMGVQGVIHAVTGAVW